MLVILAWSWLIRAARVAESGCPPSNNWRRAVHLWAVEREDANPANLSVDWLLDPTWGCWCALLPTRQPPWRPAFVRLPAMSAVDVPCPSLPTGWRVRAVALRP